MPDSDLTVITTRPVPFDVPDVAVKWTVTTAPPSRAERFAVRIHRRSSSRGPWWIVAGLLALNVAIDAWRGQTTTMSLVFFVLVVSLLALVAWERGGFCELLARYDAELREAQSQDQPA